MLFSTGIAIFLIPPLFVVVERLAHALGGEAPKEGETGTSTPSSMRPIDSSAIKGELKNHDGGDEAERGAQIQLTNPR